MVAEELHDVLSNKTIWIFGLIMGSVLLFGAWDVETTLIGIILAAAVLIYPAQYRSIDLLWET